MLASLRAIVCSCVIALSAFVSVNISWADDTFARKYEAYQQVVSEGRAALDRKEVNGLKDSQIELSHFYSSNVHCILN
jgi:hypothetical protein